MQSLKGYHPLVTFRLRSISVLPISSSGQLNTPLPFITLVSYSPDAYLPAPVLPATEGDLRLAHFHRSLAAYKVTCP
jgi:hypothetical protein